MSWFKPKHPLTTSEQVALEKHLHWLQRNLGAPACDSLTQSSSELVDLNLRSAADLPKLEAFLRSWLGFEMEPMTVQLVPDNEDLDQPHFTNQHDTIFLRDSQLLNLEESVSHIAADL